MTTRKPAHPPTPEAPCSALRLAMACRDDAKHQRGLGLHAEQDANALVVRWREMVVSQRSGEGNTTTGLPPRG